MESLNSYISDGESDSSPCEEARRKSNCGQEADANCELITMDMSEDSRSSHSDGDNRNNNDHVEPPKRQYSKSLSPSPATSFSSRESSPSAKKKDDRSSSRLKEPRNRRFDDDRLRKDRDHKRDDRDHKRDDDRDRKYVRDRSKDTYSSRDKDADRHHSSRRYESKRSSYKSRSRSRSRSYSRHGSSKRKVKSRSRSRSRSHDRHRHRNSPRRSSKRRSSPYKSRRSRSRSQSKEKSRSYDWKSNSKLKVLEKLGIEIKLPAAGLDAAQTSVLSQASNSQLTPQLLLQKTMEQQVEKVKTATGIELPSYYNPIAVNPTKYAEQIQKRRLLWGNKDKQPPKPAEEAVPVKPTDTKGSGTIWQGATFGGDQDGKMTAKFKRLMGIKNVEKEESGNTSKTGGSDLIKKQEEMFHSMESQYEVARLATHSHRGLGLGFGTFQPR